MYQGNHFIVLFLFTSFLRTRSPYSSLFLSHVPLFFFSSTSDLIFPLFFFLQPISLISLLLSFPVIYPPYLTSFLFIRSQPYYWSVITNSNSHPFTAFTILPTNPTSHHINSHSPKKENTTRMGKKNLVYPRKPVLVLFMVPLLHSFTTIICLPITILTIYSLCSYIWKSLLFCLINLKKRIYWMNVVKHNQGQNHMDG